jgi:hypothetical protein
MDQNQVADLLDPNSGDLLAAADNSAQVVIGIAHIVGSANASFIQNRDPTPLVPFAFARQ